MPNATDRFDSALDRAYGKPAVKEERATVDLPPVDLPPVVIQLTQ
jgi:hypothetical protein